MIFVVKAGTDLTIGAEVDMFVAEDEVTALEGWQEALDSGEYLSMEPIPERIDIYELVPVLMNKKVNQ